VCNLPCRTGGGYRDSNLRLTVVVTAHGFWRGGIHSIGCAAPNLPQSSDQTSGLDDRRGSTREDSQPSTSRSQELYHQGSASQPNSQSFTTEGRLTSGVHPEPVTGLAGIQQPLSSPLPSTATNLHFAANHRTMPSEPPSPVRADGGPLKARTTTTAIAQVPASLGAETK